MSDDTKKVLLKRDANRTFYSK